MFDHVRFGVSDYAAIKAFCLKALEPLAWCLPRRGRPSLSDGSGIGRFAQCVPRALSVHRT